MRVSVDVTFSARRSPFRWNDEGVIHPRSRAHVLRRGVDEARRIISAVHFTLVDRLLMLISRAEA